MKTSITDSVAKILFVCMVSLFATAPTGRTGGTVVAWGADGYGQTNAPLGLTNVVSIAAGDSFSVAVKSDGTVVAWGVNNSGQVTVPEGLSNVTAVAAGPLHTLALKRDGTVVGWGDDTYNKATGGANLTGVAAIGAGQWHSMALLSNGLVAVWGQTQHGQGNIPSGASNVIAIAVGGHHNLALTSSGQVYAWGYNASGEINVPPGLSNIVAIAGGYSHSLALKQDGTVISWGSMNESSVPAVIGGLVAIDAGWDHNLGIYPNGIVVGWGNNSSGQISIPNSISNVVAIAAGANHSVAIQSYPTPKITIQPPSQSVVNGDTVAFQITATSESPLFYRWRKEGIALADATNSTLSLSNVTTNDAGHYDVVVTNAFGSVTSTQAVLQVLPYGAPSLRMNGQLVAGSFTVAAPETITVSITGGFTNGFIFYTLDGTEPNLGSAFYAGPFTLTNSVTVVAMSLSADLIANSVTPAVKALIVPTYGLLTSVLGSGTVGASPAQASYVSNSVVTLNATPGPHYVFDHWSGDLTGSVNPTSLPMNGPRSVQAVFVASEYPLTLTGTAGGAVTANGQSIGPEMYFAVGSVVSLAAMPDNGWGFLGWEGTATSTNNPLLLVMNYSNIVQGVFGTTVLNVSTPGGGTVTVNGQSIAPNTQYPPGTVVTLAAVPDSGWSFLRWDGAATSTNNPFLLAMNQSKNVQAIFGTVVRTVVAGSGNISLNPSNPVPYGTTITATAVPTASYSFLAWSGAVSGNVNPTSLTVTSPSPLIGGVFTGPPVPVVVTQPANLTVVLGSSATLEVLASGAAPLRYQWRKEANAIAQATNSTYIIPSVVQANAGNYDVVISNVYGSITSAVATLTVAFPSSITVQPVGQVVASGTAVTLSAVAGGTEPLAYQWLNSTGPIPNATNASYTIDSATTNDAGNYYVAVANAYGTATSQAATLTVYVPVTFTSQPAQQVVPFKGTAVFSASASGYPAASYQWLFDGAMVAGANGSSLLLTNVSTNALGGYSVIAWNTYSAATSSVAMLLMSPSIRAPFLGATAVWGKSATLTASAVGSGELSYQWFKDGTAIPSGTSATLMFPTVQLTDAGLYSVVVSSPWGSATNTPAQLVVNPANISLAMYAGVTIDGVAGYTYGIQYSTDLRNTNAWVTVTNYTLSIPVETWIDFESAGGLKRFYRVVVP